MSALLYLPGILLVLFRRSNIRNVVAHIILLVSFQLAIARPFLLGENYQDYFAGAFNFGRAFLYKWTVNWRFVDEETFLSPDFAKMLLAGHVATLLIFVLFKWCRKDGGAFSLFFKGMKNRNVRGFSPALVPVTPDCKYLTTFSFIDIT